MQRPLRPVPPRDWSLLGKMHAGLDGIPSRLAVRWGGVGLVRWAYVQGKAVGHSLWDKAPGPAGLVTEGLQAWWGGQSYGITE